MYPPSGGKDSFERRNEFPPRRCFLGRTDNEVVFSCQWGLYGPSRQCCTASTISLSDFWGRLLDGCPLWVYSRWCRRIFCHSFPIRYRPSPNVTRFQSENFQTVELAVTGSVLVTRRSTTGRRMLFTTARVVLAMTLECFVKKYHKSVVDVHKLTRLENRASMDVDPSDFGFLLM